MLFELSEVQKQEALIDNLQESRKNIQDRLIRSYSKNDHTKYSLQEKFGSILKQSALLIHLFREIEQGVQYKKLLPTLLNQKDINKLLYSTTVLPDWFDHVFSKEYDKEKINLEAIASKMYKLHGLSEKNSQMVKSHWNLEVLLKRYESLSEKDLESMDIISEVENFEFLYKSCKEMLKNFLQMMTKKVVEFLQNTVESTMLYSNQLKKVKSFQERGFKNVLMTYNTSGLQSARSIPFEVSNGDSRNTIVKSGSKMNFQYETESMRDYYLDSGKGRTIKNNSTVESLRQREKANNQHFFRQLQENNILSNNSFTKDVLKTARSHQAESPKVYGHSPSQNYLRQRENSRDSSMHSGRSFYEESNVLKKHKSSSNLHQLNNHVDTSISMRQGHIQPSRISSKYVAERESSNIKQKPIGMNEVLSRSKSSKCLHHCPHHDKSLNNHCTKHCEKLCSHQKTMMNDFGIDLSKMEKQYYESKYRNNNQGMSTVRSSGRGSPGYQSPGVQSPRGEKTSREREIANRYNFRQSNLAEANYYLRNCHDKHSEYYQSRVMSPGQRQSSQIYSRNLQSPSQNYGNSQNQFFYQRAQRSTHKPTLQQSSIQKTKLQSPHIRSTQYYYLK